MAYPDNLYYTEKSTETEYGLVPQGTPAVSRLINGRPYWPKPNANTKPKPKTLILADWTIRRWTKEKAGLVIDRLKTLIDDGFKVYLWDRGIIYPLAKESLYHLKALRFKAPFPKNMRDTITSQYPEFTAENSYIIDDYELNNLMQNNTKLEKRTISVQDLEDYGQSDEDRITFLASYIKTVNSPLNIEVNCLKYPYGSTQLIKAIRSSFPQVPLETAYRTLQIIHNSPLPEIRLLQNIEELKLYTFSLLGKIQELCTQLPHLKDLSLNFTSPQDELLNSSDALVTNFETKNWHLPSLKNLQLTNWILSIEQLNLLIKEAKQLTNLSIDQLGHQNLRITPQDLFKNAPNLKTLSLQGMEIIASDSLYTMPNIERLELSSVQGSSSMLQQLVGDGSKLRSLDINACTTTDEKPLRIEELTLTNLEEFYSATQDLSPAALKSILSCPKLKKLKFYYQEEALNELQAKDIPSFLTLIDLNLDTSPISAAALQAIIATGQLKYLTLNNVALNIDCTNLPLLSSMEVLVLKDKQCTDEQLKSFLDKTPQLRELNICGSSKITRIGGKNLSKLKIVDASHTSISMNSLRNFLAGAPAILRMELRSCTLTDPCTSIDIPTIQHLGLDGTAITLENLTELLANANALEHLDLRNLKTTTSDFTKKPMNLRALKSLKLSGSNLTEEYFLFLLENAPNLQEISFYDYHDTTPINSWSLATRQKIADLKITIPHREHLERDLILSKEYTPSDPLHNPTEHFKPKKESVFKFTGKNKTLNQNMIIEKLSQYLTLTKQHIDLIPKIQKGICRALAMHFNTMTPAKWTGFVSDIAAWDGSQNTLNNELAADFEGLWQAVQEHHLDQSGASQCYLGDNLASFLATKPASIILKNPWHSVSLRYLKDQQCWCLYDPNYINGFKANKDLNLILGFIKQSLGQLVLVEGMQTVTPLINDTDVFLRDGGLLALVAADNPTELLKILTPLQDYPKDALEGLLMRDVYGRPCWQIALKNPLLAPYTLALLAQFTQKHPDYKEKLQQSLVGTTPAEQHETLVYLTQAAARIPVKHPLLEELCDITRPKINEDYRRRLETWNKPLATAISPKLYCQQLVAKDTDKKKLVAVDSNTNAQALSLELLRYCQSVSRPVFYINSPDDLICSASWVERIGKDKGIIRKGPGGPLHDFLMKHAGQSPVLVVNYANFKADDLVRFNSLLDKKRLADNTPLPDDAIVVGLINPNAKDAYQGADFYSRFDRVETSPLSAEALKNSIPSAPAVRTSNEDVYTINLAHSPQWEERLLGRWLIKKDALVFEEGELSRAIASKKTICIQNGLWDQPRFQHLWQQVQIQGCIAPDGQVIKLPKDLLVTRKEDWDWSDLKPLVRFSDSTEKPLLLNPKSLPDLFHTYDYDESTNTLDSQPGLIERNKGKQLHLHITRSLSEDEWGSILETCQKHQVQLVCQRAPGVTIPKDLSDLKPIAAYPVRPWAATDKNNPLLITSTDAAATVASLTQKDANWLSIDVTECDAGALLSTLDGRMDQAHFIFTKRIGAVQKALQENKKVVLHGQFSDELMDALAPLLLNPITKGRLVLVSDNPNTFTCAPSIVHQVTPEERHQLLNATEEEMNSLPDKKASFTTMQAQLSYHRAFPARPNTPWQGMNEALLPNLPAFDALNTKKVADAFMQQRFNDVTALLKHAPFVCLTGPSGIGKSAFVEEYLAKQPGMAVFKGESRINDWINDDSDGQKILFIDEANITSRQWSEFEGLYNKPPGIMVNGVYRELSPNHKVIFAFNPLNYGGERQQSPLFTRHGNALAFSPLPLELIDEYMLKPVLAGSPLAAQHRALMEPILKVYRFIVEQTQENVLISPREVQMMALLLLSYAKNHPEASPEDHQLAAEHYAYQLGCHLTKPAFQQVFEALFKPKKELPQTLPKQQGQFYMTPSRQIVAQQVDDLLVLRTLRKAPGSNKVLQYGGLGGMVMEGAPGVGKSELVTCALRARGYIEIHDYNGPALNPPPANIFYRMPVSMQIEDKQRLLLKAFDEGAVVIVDEINSSPMMERLLNALLMGKTPENKAPKNPGFCIIGTQNPPKMGGRFTASTAWARRFMNTPLADYVIEELQGILLSQGVHVHEANLMIEAYLFNCVKAENEHLKPAPTFRDLLRLAEPHILLARKNELNLKRQALVDGVNDAQTQFDYATLLIEIEHNYVSALPHLKRAALNDLPGAQEAAEIADKLVKSKTPDERALVQKDLNTDDATLCFFEQHRQTYTKSRNEFFGSFRRTEVKPNWDLEDILAHGMKANNRTRSVCVELGWLTSDGMLNENAPAVILEACEAQNGIRKPMLP